MIQTTDFEKPIMATVMAGVEGGRIAYIDYLKGYCILVVVMNHVGVNILAFLGSLLLTPQYLLSMCYQDSFLIRV